MHKCIAILATLLFISAVSIQVQAGELKLGNDLAIGQGSDQKTSTMKSKIDMQAEPYDDIEISDGVSAGIITERKEFSMENNHRTPTQEKGREVGVGISVSF